MMEAAMSGVISRSFRAYGHLCAQNPWEVIFLLITATIALATTSHSSPPAHQHELGDGSLDTAVMTVVRCGALLYLYHQLRLLHRRTSGVVLGMSFLFVFFTGLVYSCCVVKLLGSPLSNLKDAVFLFVFVLDFTKLERLSSLAVASKPQDLHNSIANSFAQLAPGYTLDSCVEALLIGAGSLSGVARLQQLCQFTVLSIVVNHLSVMSFYPAALSLVLQMCGGVHDRKGVLQCSSCQSNRDVLLSSACQSPHTPVMHRCTPFSLDSVTCDPPHNPVRQKLKVIMSAGLMLVHGISRYSVVTIAGTTPHHTTSLRSTAQTLVELTDEDTAHLWGQEQTVFVLLVVLLLIRYTMFESPSERHHPSSRRDSQDCTDTQKDIKAWVSSGMVSTTVEESVATTSVEENVATTTVEESVATTTVEESVATTTVEGSLRPMEECKDILNSTKEGAKLLSDAELVSLVRSKYIKGHMLESTLGDCSRSVHIRRLVLSESLPSSSALEDLPHSHYDYSKVVGVCCENVIGYMPIPVGVAGPLSINGLSHYIPMATTEGCLVAGTNRGCRALQAAKGCYVTVVDDAMSRSAVVALPTLARAREVCDWVRNNFPALKAVFDETSNYARLREVEPTLASRDLYLRFVAPTGDAMGMNMLSKGTEAVLQMLQERFSDLEVLSVSSNMCTDKKPSAINWLKGRGKTVVCGAVLPGAVVKEVLKTSVQRMIRCHQAKNMVGSALAGSIGGNNAHAANIVAAVYIACGQDPAQVVESSNCLTTMQPHGEEDLFVSVRLPSLEVGTVGGGTRLPAQAAALNMMNVKGSNSSRPGANAQQLAMIVAGAVLAGEVNILAVQAAGQLVNSHMKLNRAKDTTQENKGCEK